MLKVVGVVDDKFRVLDPDDGVEDVVTAEELVLYISDGVEFDGCEYGEKGLKVWYDGVEPYDVAVEVWKPVRLIKNGIEIPNFYEVSNLGRVRRGVYGRFRGVRMRSIARNEKGYRQVTFRINEVYYLCKVHRLVALSFIPNPHNLPCINHKDETPGNDWASNLEWCTQKYNCNYGGHNRRMSLSKSQAVRKYSLDGSFVSEYSSGVRAASLHSCTKSVISLCCMRAVRIAVGFVWRATDDDELFDMSVSERKSLFDSYDFHFVKNRGKCVRKYSSDGEFLDEFSSATQAAKTCGTIEGICKCCRRVICTSVGYIWRYVDDDEFADRPENRVLIEEFHKTHK